MIIKKEREINNEINFSQAVFAKCSTVTTLIGRPRMTDRCRIVQKIIKSDGPMINIRKLSKDMRNITTECVKGNLVQI